MCNHTANSDSSLADISYHLVSLPGGDGMKRTMAFLGAVVLSLCLAMAGTVLAQERPVDAANDSLTTTGGEVAPTTSGNGPTAMESEPVTTHTRTFEKTTYYYLSLGLGSAYNYLPDAFRDGYSPSFGAAVAGGVGWKDLRFGVSFSFSFFLSQAATTLYPDDLNCGTAFLEVKYGPTKSQARPYILACGGYYRQWIVNAHYTETVLGYGGGAGVDIEIDKVRHLFIEGRYIEGETRETEKQANTVLIPFHIGVSWIL